MLFRSASPEQLAEVLPDVLQEGDLLLTQGAGNIGALSRKLAASELGFSTGATTEVKP